MSTQEAEAVQKRCQRGTASYATANELHADCYRVIGRLLRRIQALERGEFICQQCGLRKDGNPQTEQKSKEPPF